MKFEFQILDISSDSNHKFQRSSEVMNVPVVQSTILPGDMLAAKIRTYLSQPVTWQPSADQHRLIGHMVLHKTSGSQGDLGLKTGREEKESNKNLNSKERKNQKQVVGGRRSDTGRLGAFITRVKPGSVADTVGRLRGGLHCEYFSKITSFLKYNLSNCHTFFKRMIFLQIFYNEFSGIGNLSKKLMI
uniref:Uncharacterized protein n=1 Tax=Elaeophora elaphi TaxID=1147741 RepID=A0A0R3S789_9BILA